LLLCLIASIAGNFCLLIQFIRAHEPQPLLAISWIFRLKNICFIFLTVFLNCLQSSMHFEDLYFSRSLLQFKFHQLLECLVILIVFEYWAHKLFVVWTMVWIELSSKTISEMLDNGHMITYHTEEHRRF